ncbi:MAG: bifunctional methylenetetrahydrofolate dehydrogenase/methenyltetrahydrofolate cyclohydrolase FolD [Firmicutes bacterium]|nr:bifunctional methylenetetrahydrofolate dehydrogenase/methenyltetrahydrofolate cyclohydrolase FolD [Bacillota bacterium]
MSAKIIDGKKIAEQTRGKLKAEAEAFVKKYKRQPGLAVVLVGEDPASKVYVGNKVAGCEQVGIKSFAHYLAVDVTQVKLIELIDKLNRDKAVDGILVQLPLPKHIDERTVLARLDPKKDVDCFSVSNAGALLLGEPCLAACTPAGCIELIKSTGVSMSGLNAVVIGRSNIVGKPMAMLLLQENCTVTICHSRTKDLAKVTKQADILVAAIGKKEFVTGDMVKSGAIVIDVGINRHEGKLYGDVNFGEVSKVAGYITPVPGGVGPMTITMLLANTLKAARA